MELPKKYFSEKSLDAVVGISDEAPWNISVEHCSLLISDKLNTLDCSVWRRDHSVDSNWLTQSYIAL